MADVNHVILIGRLTRDAELKYTAGGQAICRFAMAVNRKKKQADSWVDEVSFFDVVLWGRQGESLNQYLTKGKQVAVEGELRQERWEKDGQNHSRVEIVAENIQFLGGGGNAESGRGGAQASPGRDSHAPSASDRKAVAPSGSQGSSDDGFADDIPF